MRGGGTERDNKRKGVIFGAAVGDALGVPFEFKGRDSFDCTENRYRSWHL